MATSSKPPRSGTAPKKGPKATPSEPRKYDTPSPKTPVYLMIKLTTGNWSDVNSPQAISVPSARLRAHSATAQRENFDLEKGKFALKLSSPASLPALTYLHTHMHTHYHPSPLPLPTPPHLTSFTDTFALYTLCAALRLRGTPHRLLRQRVLESMTRDVLTATETRAVWAWCVDEQGRVGDKGLVNRMVNALVGQYFAGAVTVERDAELVACYAEVGELERWFERAWWRAERGEREKERG